MAVGNEGLCDTVCSDARIRTRYSDDEDSVPRGDNAELRVLTIRKEDATVMSYIRYAAKYFITEQQVYRWREE